jgi:drug/metabolite transporter (DMT)-like permease
MNRITASLLVLLGATSYGMLGPFVKMAYDAGFVPADVISSQFVFALLILAGLAVLKWRSFKKLTRKDIGLLSMLGALSTGTSLFYYLSLKYLPASMAIVLLFQFTWVVMVIDYLVARKKPAPGKWFSLVLVMAGTVLAVNLFETKWEQVSMLGVLLGALSSVTYSAFLYWNEKVESAAPPQVNSFVLGLASTIAVFFVFPPKFIWNGTLYEGLWVWALIIGSLGQVIPPILFNKGVPVVGGALSGLLASIELPVAVIAAALLLGETVDPVKWLGIGMIVAGIIVAELLDRASSQMFVKARE